MAQPVDDDFEDLMQDAGEVSELLARLPTEVLDSFTAEQRAALWDVSHSSTWKRHPINIRLTLNLFGRRLFLTVVGGTERRSGERLARERRLHPLRTMGNLLFLAGWTSLFVLLGVAVTLLFRSVFAF